MAQPTQTDVHIDRALTDLSLGFIQNPADFAAPQVFPVVSVINQTDKYFTWTRDNFYRDSMERRPPGAESAGGGMDISNDSYSCDVWALHKDIDDQTRANTDTAVQLESATTSYLSQQGLRRMNRQWAADYFTTSVWDTDVVGGTDFTVWDNGASNPQNDIFTGKETVLQNTGFEPNTLVVSYSVHIQLKQHPAIRDVIKYTSSDSITADLIARYFEVDKYVVDRGVYNTANEGATASFAFTIGKHALLCYSPPAPGLMTPAAGYTFVWSRYTGMNDLGVRMKNMRMEHLESDRLELSMAFDLKVVASELGYFFSGAVS